MKSRQRRALCAILLSVNMTSVVLGQNPQPLTQKDMSAQPAAAEAAPHEPPEMPEMPASPPKVTCKGDQLSIAAKGSSLASILTAVRECTGAKIDFPEGADLSRFFDTLGPGPVRQVLASLLDATDFNYVIESSDSDPEKVETVELIARVESPGPESTTDRALTPNRRAFLQMRQNYLTVGVPGENNASTPAPDSNPAAAISEPPQQPANGTSATQPAPTDQAPLQGVSDTNPAPNQSTAPPPSDASQPPTQPASVEDQIKNMQQLFKQRQQMIANQAQH